jgi:large subunit ribosomal protein L10
MTREDKSTVIEELSSQFETSRYFYITDHSSLSVAKTNALRRICFEKGIKLTVVKNSFIKKALEKASLVNNENYSELNSALKGFSAIMFSDNGNLPAKTIKEFRGDDGKPALKAAFIDSAIFIGDDQLESLEKIKSKTELIGELIGMLQSPMQNLLGSLQYGSNTIGGLLKSLEERQ